MRIVTWNIRAGDGARAAAIGAQLGRWQADGSAYSGKPSMAYMAIRSEPGSPSAPNQRA